MVRECVGEGRTDQESSPKGRQEVRLLVHVQVTSSDQESLLLSYLYETENKGNFRSVNGVKKREAERETKRCGTRRRKRKKGEARRE